ncbi:leucine-rich repeat domain-containing protein [Ichthyenterobacterium sp. W332]|uniref:Leucine-rich repeat domain-containing protein n=1 Tax=Microcosmobacter mediterraneus TaxID=3075607 RepID=A0ABU2YGQ4_9FLAO|nr:leucine-rich repeat domain-containing protein [Ichthyenterobacterium sp. W332]MDT0557326.1 leucine-rich repeat domain-containing protein [Ichthyenterobacterium sp. W332]
MSLYRFIITLLVLSLFSITLQAQRAKAESASSVYFAIPSYDIASSNPNDFTYSFAMPMTNFNSPEQFKGENVCVASGSKNVLKDAKNITVYQYRVTADVPDAYLIIKSSSGDILYAEAFNNYKTTTSIFSDPVNFVYGKDECYWHPQVLEEAWEKDNETWLKEQHNRIKSSTFEDAQSRAENAFKMGYVSYSLNVYTGKGGKDYDYSALDKAQQLAISAYDSMHKQGNINQQSLDELMIAVNTWLTHVKDYNTDNNRAKINDRVVRGLYINLATAHYQMFDFDKAMEYLGLHADTYNNAVSRGTSPEVINLSQLITNQQKGMAANPNISIDFTALNKTAMANDKINITVKDLGENKADELAGEHHFYAKDAKKEASIAASGGSIYKSNINQGQYGPTLVMMSVFDGDLTEFPVEVTQLNVKGIVFTGGYSFTRLPAEIGNMTNLEQINLMDSSITSVPDEIGNLTNLKRLNLSRTQISSLPESIKNLKNLKVLNIKKTKISEADVEKIKSWLPKKCKVRF